MRKYIAVSSIVIPIASALKNNTWPQIIFKKVMIRWFTENILQCKK